MIEAESVAERMARCSPSVGSTRERDPVHDTGVRRHHAETRSPVAMGCLGRDPMRPFEPSDLGRPEYHKRDLLAQAERPFPDC